MISPTSAQDSSMHKEATNTPNMLLPAIGGMKTASTASNPTTAAAW
jgi:hypothetical protein